MIGGNRNNLLKQEINDGSDSRVAAAVLGDGVFAVLAIAIDAVGAMKLFRKSVELDLRNEAACVFVFFGAIAATVAAGVYGFHIPGFYFHLALKDVQWEYLAK